MRERRRVRERPGNSGILPHKTDREKRFFVWQCRSVNSERERERARERESEREQM